jgi:hypothetical protein
MVQPPIVLDAKSEILLFRSVERAEAYIEAIDVRNMEYGAAYDSAGRRFDLGTKSVARRALLGLIRYEVEFADLRVTGDEPIHATEIAQLLRTHLLRQGGEDLSEKSVSELVAMAVERLGFTA